jgi:hypothetical protein
VACVLFVGGTASPPPTMTGYVRTVDFVTAEGARVRWSGSGRVASVAADGRFVLPVEPEEGGSGGELLVTLNGYYTAAHRVEGGTSHAGTVLLVPRRWRISTGAHAGTEVEVDLVGATGAGCRGCGGFYREVLGDERSALPPGIPTWPPTAFPLQVAFDRENGGRVSAADSASFWRVVHSLEEQFGLRLFRPASLATVLANVSNEGPGSLLVLIDPRLPSIGWGSSVAQSGDILAGAVHFRSAHTFSAGGASEVVAHEVFHALGFGHTCAWRSVVAEVTRCRTLQAPLPTAEDVAHAQLLWRIRDLEREARVWTTVEGSLRGAS